MLWNQSARRYSLCAHLTIIFCTAIASACGSSDGFVGSENAIPAAGAPPPVQDDEQKSAVQQGNRNDSENNNNSDENGESNHTVISESEYVLSHEGDADYIDVTFLLTADNTFDKDMIVKVTERACKFKNKTLILVIDDRWSGNKKPLKDFLKILQSQKCQPAAVHLMKKKLPNNDNNDNKDKPKNQTDEKPKETPKDKPKDKANDTKIEHDNPPPLPKNKEKLDSKLPGASLNLSDFEFDSENEFSPE